VLQQQRQPLRILVAEDNLTNQAIIRQLLERAGHTVIIASDGEEALDLYADTQPELAILDFNMPERNGIEVCTAIRTMEPTGTRLPVIILSASVTVEARERVQRAGADEFVGKPFESAALLQVIDRLARRAGRGAPIRARASTPTEFPLVDRLRLAEVERIATDSAFLAQLLRGFRDDVEILLKRLDGLVASEQTSAIVDITHAIKGASLGVGAKQLAELCSGIDAAAAGAQIAQLRTLSTEMRRCFEATNLEFVAYTQHKQRASL
jgi:two-component system sensor histidine kinase RpfC